MDGADELHGPSAPSPEGYVLEERAQKISLADFAGSFDPYSVTGNGVGFALAWRGSPRFNIGVANKQFETIQISSDELLVVMPESVISGTPRSAMCP